MSWANVHDTESATKRVERRSRVSVPGGSHRTRGRERSRKQTQMKGGITDNGKESEGREEEGRQETLSRPHRKKEKGGGRRPLFNWSARQTRSTAALPRTRRVPLTETVRPRPGRAG